MRRLAVVLAIAGLLACVAWLIATRRAEPQHETARANEAPAASQTGADSKLVAPIAADSPDTRVETAAPNSVETASPPPKLAHVRGRCVAAESSAPLAGCIVKFEGGPGDLELLAHSGEIHWSDPAPIVTAADGLFDVAFAPPPPYQFSLSVECEGRAPRTARWGELAPDAIEDLGDVALQRGFIVDGRVTDTAGAPIVDAWVGIRHLPLPLRAEMFANDTRGGHSDANGYFRSDVAIPVGTWSLDARADGFKLVSPDTVEVAERRGAAPLAVVMRAMPSISGVVVDETGAGVERVEVEVDSKRSGRKASAWTRADGSFTLHAVEDDANVVPLRIDDPGPCEPPDAPLPEFAWGTRDVRIELRRARSFELTVVERESGAPVEDYSVSCYADRWTSSLQQEARLDGHHPGGRVTVDKVWRGTNRLTVLPLDLELAENAELTIEVGGAPLPPMRVELNRKHVRIVRVVTARHVAIEGSKVELVALGDDDFDVDSIAIDPSRPGLSSSGGSHPHVLLAAAITDAHGIAKLHDSGASVRFGLRATGDAQLPLVQSDVQFPAGDEPLELVVAIGGRIAGSVRLEGYAPSGVSLTFTPMTRDPEWSGRDLHAPISADGTFASPSLPPGECSLHFTIPYQFRREHSGEGSTLWLEPALATLSVNDGETTRADLDARKFAPSSVSGTVLMNGAPFSECRVILELADDRNTPFGQFVPDAAGHFDAAGLPPGTWRAALVVGDFKTTDGDVLHADANFDLAPGAKLERNFEFVRRRLTLRILEPDGATRIANRDVELQRDGSFSSRRTDDDGRVVLDPADSGKFRIVAGEWISDPIEMPTNQSELALDVVLHVR